LASNQDGKMKASEKQAALVVVLCVLFSACASDEESRKETYPVTGEVYVDGSPAAQVSVKCHNVAGLDAENPTLSSAFTDENGKFEISTYESADGVPAGNYVLTFMWGKWNQISMTYGGPDKLNDRYTDPKDSQFKVTVEDGKPTEVPKIELTTK